MLGEAVRPYIRLDIQNHFRIPYKIPLPNRSPKLRLIANPDHIMSRCSIGEILIEDEKGFADSGISQTRGSDFSGSLDGFKPSARLVRPIRVVEINFKVPLK